MSLTTNNPPQDAVRAGNPLTVSRRNLLALAGGATLMGAAFHAGVTAPMTAQAEPTSDPHAVVPLRQFRGLWIASVVNIDWPSKTGLSAAQQQQEFIALLDMAEKLNLNAIVSQIRPAADAFWPSEYEPWSMFLTGTQGKDPGYDPLAFQIEQTHKRNMEYHGWFNPYRVAMEPNTDKLVPNHPARVHPDWTFAYGPKTYYNPGIPEVRKFVQDAMMDAVTKYDLDAVHFDDYFYPYPVKDPKDENKDLDYPDAATFAKYGNGMSPGDWRRDNINKLVREMGERIHKAKPYVKFGISPFGIWKNKEHDPLGSNTTGSESYYSISADTRLWIKQGWIDYVNPQIYWQIGLKVADYAMLVPWWADAVMGTDVALYIGQAVYRYNEGKPPFEADELTKHLDFNKDFPEVKGDVFFSATDVRKNTSGAMTKVFNDHYRTLALVPVIKHLGGKAPKNPTGVKVSATNDGVNVEWDVAEDATRYAIYWVPEDRKVEDALNDPKLLLASLPKVSDGSGRQSRRLINATTSQKFVVVALDRLWNMSGPGTAASPAPSSSAPTSPAPSSSATPSKPSRPGLPKTGN